MSGYLTVRLSVYLRMFLVCVSAWLSDFLFVCLLSVCLHVCLSAPPDAFMPAFAGVIACIVHAAGF